MFGPKLQKSVPVPLPQMIGGGEAKALSVLHAENMEDSDSEESQLVQECSK